MKKADQTIKQKTEDDRYLAAEKMEHTCEILWYSWKTKYKTEKNKWLVGRFMKYYRKPKPVTRISTCAKAYHMLCLYLSLAFTSQVGDRLC